MSTEGDRRAQGIARVPFEALVEVGGALGPSFEAHAIDVSEQGMHLRTVYLPEVGQPLTCRFETGPGQTVLASGEVTWTEAAKSGGEFGIKFTDLDDDSVEALKGAMNAGGADTEAEEPVALQAKGSKVRLHIEGLGAPMKARVKDAETAAVTVGSELGFLQVGKQLDLEDTLSGLKRPARIDRVDVEVDPKSHVPQLVVTLKYSDTRASIGSMPAASASTKNVSTAAPTSARTADEISVDEVAAPEDEDAMAMKGGFARTMAGIGPRMEGLARQAKTTIALLAARARTGTTEEARPARRTTAPPPGGAYQSNGRKVRPSGADVASSILAEEGMKSGPISKSTMRRGIALGAAAVVAVALIAMAAHKSPPKEVAVAPVEPPPAAPVVAAVEPQVPVNIAPPVVQPPPPAPVAETAVAKSDVADEKEPKAHKHVHVAVAPFSNGPVHHGTLLRLHMDGPVEAIQGAPTPTGFTVKIPNRKATEPAGPLAARDSRIGAIRVTNEPTGAEFSVTFKDGVPNYRVTAKGDALEISLATIGAEESSDHEKAIAKKDAHGSKHHKHKATTDTTEH